MIKRIREILKGFSGAALLPFLLLLGIIFIVIFAPQHFEIKKQSQLAYIAPGANFVLAVSSAAKLEDIKKQLKIEPGLKGELTKNYDELIFTPSEPVKAGEKYKIIYSPKIIAGKGKYEEQSFEFIFEVVAGLSIYPVSSSNRDLYTFNAYDKERVISFVNLYDVKKLEVELFKSDLQAYLNQYTKEEKDTSKLKPINTWALDCEDKDSVMVKLPSNQDGLYLIKTKNQKGEKAFFHYLVTPYAMLSRQAGDRWCLLAVDVKSGNVLPDMKIDYYSFNGDKSLKKLVSGKTDARGFSYSNLADSDKPKIIIGELGGKWVINDIARKEWWGDSDGQDSRQPSYQAYLYTDRPLYKPGDMVNFKGIVRIDDDAKYTIPTGQEILLEVQGDWNTPPIYKKSFKCNNEGIFYGSFRLNEELKTGDYSLYAKIGGHNESWTSILVEKYVKPEFELKLTCDKEKCIQGEKMAFKTSAVYFFGQPVVGQKVHYKVLARELGYWDWYGYGGGEEIENGEAILNSQGEAVIVLTAPPTKRQKAVTVEFSLADESGRPSSTSRSVMVLGSGLNINVDHDYFWGGPGQAKHLPISVLDASDKPVKGIGLTAKVFKVDYFYGEDGDEYSSAEQKKKLMERKIKTAEDGKAAFSFTPQESGEYRVFIEATDQKGKSVSREFYFWVWGRPVKAANRKTEVLLVPNKESYRPGDEAGIYASLPLEKGVVMFTLTRGKLYKAWTQIFSDYKTSFVLPVTDAFMPNIFLQADVYAESRFNSTEKKLVVPAASKKIKLEVIPESHNGLPGRSIEVAVKTSDEKGRPVRANASLALVDKALFALQSDNVANIFDAFYSERGNNVRAYNSMDNPIASGAEKGGCFLEGTKITMADGRLLTIEEVNAGDSVLTKLSENNSRLCPAKVAQKFKHVVEEYFIINDSLRVTPPHIMRVNDSWQEAWKIKKGDRLLDVNGNPVEVKQIEHRKEPVTVYNLMIDERHTFFADGVYVHNEKGEDMPRKNFVDVAYWNPNIQTDSNGIAKVKIQLPDNLTTWVAHSKAVSRDTKVGQGEDEIIVSKPLFIRPLLPRFLRNGDRVELKAMVHNYSRDSQLVTVALGADKIKLLTDKKHQILLAPGEAKTVRWQAIAPQVNMVILAFSAKAKKEKDTVILKLPVKPFGEKVEFSRAGRAPGRFEFRRDRQAMTPFSRYSLTISPSIASKFPAMIQALVDYPYGCTEQTMSKLYPTALVYRHQKALGIKPPKNIKSMLEKGLTRLAGFQHGDGGWGWWVDDQTNLQMTGYVVEGLLNIKNAKLPVHDAMLGRGVEYLKRAVTAEPDADLKAYIIYVLNEAGAADRKLAEELAKDKRLGVQGKCFVAIVLNAAGRKTEALTMLKNVKQEMKKSQYTYYWESGQDGSGKFMDSISLASSAALKMFVRLTPKDEVLPGVAQGLLREDNYHMTRDTAVKLSALTEYLVVSGELSPSYDYSVFINGKKIAGGRFSGFNPQEKVVNLVRSGLKDKNIIEIKKNGNGNMFYSFKQTEYFNKEALEAKNGKLSIIRTFQGIKGAENTEYNAGEIVKVVLNIKSAADIDYVMVEDHLPAGLEPVNMRLKNEARSLDDQGYYNDYYSWDEKDLRDDRVVTFITYLGKGEKKISYLLRAVTRGKTRAAPAEIQSMYYPEIRARSDSDVIEVR
ncbi:MAG: alpha-2-macroglobulin family protein [Candidatus Margulisiibacteriota bacterium]